MREGTSLERAERKWAGFETQTLSHSVEKLGYLHIRSKVKQAITIVAKHNNTGILTTTQDCLFQFYKFIMIDNAAGDITSV